MKSEFNQERNLDLDEQNRVWSEWDKRVRRIAHNLCKPRSHFQPGLRNFQGDLVEYCESCYRMVRAVTDLWVEVFEYESQGAHNRAQAGNNIQFVPVAAMYSAAAGILKPDLRKALDGYGVL